MRITFKGARPLPPLSFRRAPSEKRRFVQRKSLDTHCRGVYSTRATNSCPTFFASEQWNPFNDLGPTTPEWHSLQEGVRFLTR